MATSSNFGNMFSAAGASLFLSFLPMLPSQILLNNLLYDVGQMAIPTDRVDEEIVARPAAWDIAFVRRFMTVFGPVSSIFDFADVLRHARDPERRPQRVPHRLVRRVARDADARDLRHPHTPRAVLAQPAEPPHDRRCRSPARRSARSCRSRRSRHALGFTALPLAFFLILLGMIAAYLVLVELVKARFYAAHERPRPQRPTSEQKRHRHVHRRARRFTHHAPSALATRSHP